MLIKLTIKHRFTSVWSSFQILRQTKSLTMWVFNFSFQTNEYALDYLFTWCNGAK